MTAKQLQAVIQPFINGIQSASESVTIDGQDVTKTLLRRTLSEPFEVVLPTENPLGCPAAPAVDGGDYVLLPPLSPGEHTITFYAESYSKTIGHFFEYVEYDLTVMPVSLK